MLTHQQHKYQMNIEFLQCKYRRCHAMVLDTLRQCDTRRRPCNH